MCNVKSIIDNFHSSLYLHFLGFLISKFLKIIVTSGIIQIVLVEKTSASLARKDPRKLVASLLILCWEHGRANIRLGKWKRDSYRKAKTFLLVFSPWSKMTVALLFIVLLFHSGWVHEKETGYNSEWKRNSHRKAKKYFCLRCCHG